MACLTARRSLSTLISRALTSSSYSSFPSRSRLTVAFLNKTLVFIPDATKILTRTKTYGSNYSPFRDPSRLPSVFLDGHNYEHWLIILEFPERPKPLEEEMIDTYVKTLASVVDSEEEAKKRIYSVCTTTYTGFRAFFSEDLVEELGELPRVRWVLPVWCWSRDHYYAGDLFVDGKVFHRPQFPWVGIPNSNHRVGGCGDHELWLITFEFREEPSFEEKIDFYVKTLASVVGSEEEAKRRIYAVGGRLTRYTGFRAVISEEMAYLLGGFPLVKGVYRDSEVEYHEDLLGGDLLVDGEVVLRPTIKDLDGGRLVRLVADQILNDIYIRKMDETKTETETEG